VTSADSTLVATDLVDVFTFGPDHGRDTVEGFDMAEDWLVFSETATAFESARDVLAAASETPTGVTIDTGGGEVVLAGLTIDDLALVNYGFQGG